LRDFIFAYIERFQIPEKTTILAQIQTTTFYPGLTSSGGRRSSVTGQGIHTDGATYAAIACLQRDANIKGCLNQYHQNLDGSQPLCEPIALEQGDVTFFKDNEIFHYVSPGSCPDEGNDLSRCSRTVLLLHDADHYLSGRKNDSNNLGSNASGTKLREEE